MKTVLVTGVTSGIGKAILFGLLEAKCHVIGISRNEEKLNQLSSEINEKYSSPTYVLFQANLLEEEDINRVSQEVKEYLHQFSEDRLDALINNAGCVRNWYATNSKGYEHQFALNHLASFLLTYRMFPCIKKAKGRIIFTSSKSHRNMKMNWKDMMYEKHYHPLLAYKQSKLANVLFAYELNQRYVKHGIHAYAVDPGLVNTDIGLKQTGGLVSFVWKLRKQSGKHPSLPAKTFVYLVCEDKHPTGIYYYNSSLQNYSRQVSKENAARLFEISENLTNIKYGDDKWYL